MRVHVPEPSPRAVSRMVLVAAIAGLVFVAWLGVQVVHLSDRATLAEQRQASSEADRKDLREKVDAQQQALDKENLTRVREGKAPIPVPDGPQIVREPISMSAVLTGLIALCGSCEGPPGKPGAPGATGRPGAAGNDGRNGRDGESIKGDAGAPGTAGEPGPTGPAGPPGPAGQDGAPGKDGVDGKDGAPGWTCPDGSDPHPFTFWAYPGDPGPVPSGAQPYTAYAC